ncbi:ligase-associated DNA damage response endonuclease PdeM [Salegentibacter flavus]|uniref:Putative phosphoesterase n=1 Tax=Salegentibacter flavus TaxID=287099 RepID=A0A1I4ZPX8_9FLAO|nr:ligase-associated DNA damage response endonuclease PdeM [Salegentibacter flavus]SFN52314.1 putative phosphoesterase [Salegentibacter flavus]
MEIELENQHFELHPSGAAFWEEQEILIISDVHLGKISHFRKFGSPVPYKAINANFIRLSEVVGKFRPKTVCFLGDLFHSNLNNEWKLFENWLSFVEADVVLVAGNHDIISPLKYEKLGLKIHSEWQLNGFLLTHHPEQREFFFNICGHIHPGYRLNGKARQSLKLPCFFRRKDQLIFPAFGEFTGNYMMELNEGEAAYAITQKEVILISK